MPELKDIAPQLIEIQKVNIGKKQTDSAFIFISVRKVEGGKFCSIVDGTEENLYQMVRAALEEDKNFERIVMDAVIDHVKEMALLEDIKPTAQA